MSSPVHHEPGESPPTGLELLRRHIAEVEQVVDQLLDHTTLRYDDINARSCGVVYVGWSPHSWGPPKEGAQRYFGEVRQTWQSLNDLIAQAVRLSAPERTRPLEETDGLLRNLIEQNYI